MKRHLSFFLAGLCLWGLLGFGSASAAPRIGLVLSGGGARGAAHVGVLKVLEELRIPIHAIAGTSMGSLVGGAYASGLSAAELESALGGIDWSRLLTDDPPRSEWPMRRKQTAEKPTWDFTIGNNDGKLQLPSGALAGQQVQLFFSDLVKSSEGRQGGFDNLPIPFRAVATDLENGRMRVFDDGDLPVAMRASMSVPGLFSPMETGGNLYVDGGLVRNLPVDVVRSMGVDVVIAVNLGSSYLPRDQLGTVIGVTAQMVAILTEQNVEASLAQLDDRRDLLIKPDLGDISSGDFKRSKEAIAAGETAARAMAKQLRRFSVSERAYAAWRGKVEARRAPVDGNVDEVQVAGTERVNPGVFDPLMENHTGDPLDRESLKQDIQSVYARGDFERISYRLSRDDSRNLLIVDAVEKAWGPGYLSFGIGMSTDFQGDSRMGIRGLYRQTWVNDLGAEWGTEVTVGNEPSLYTEFYQPLTLDGSLFVAPYLDASQVPLSVFVDDQRVARYDVSRLRAGVDFGTTFGTAAELRAGVYAGVTDFDVDTGDLLLPEGNNADSGVKLGLVYDTLDSRFVPTDGQRFVVQAMRPMPALGADVEYTRLSASWLGAHSFGDNTLVGSLRGGTSFGDTMPYYDQFPLGGFMKLGGYANEQFRGNDYAYAGLAYYRQIAELTPPLGRGVYAGATLEAGRFFDTDLRRGSGDEDISLASQETRYSTGLFLGADTWAGPLYLGWGISAEGDNAFYALIGRP